MTLDEVLRSEQQCRVFISYKHASELSQAAMLEDILRDDLSQLVFRDRSAMIGGEDFGERLKRYIKGAHLLVIVVSEESRSSSWVQNEIGYAVAHGVPVYPVSFDGTRLEGMAAKSHRFDVEPTWTEEQRRARLRDDLGKCLANLQLQQSFSIDCLSDASSLYECAAQPEQRAVMMTRYAREILEYGHCVRVRQFGGLSSFHIPNKPLNHPIWAQRYLPGRRSPEYCRGQLAERESFDAHAAVAGCRLVIDPWYKRSDFNEDAWRIRIGCLIESLESMMSRLPEGLCQAVINHGQESPESRTILGTWFACESYSWAPHGNYRQTIFTRHATTVSRAVQRFDREFDIWLDGARPEDSCAKTIAELKEIQRGAVTRQP